MRRVSVSDFNGGIVNSADPQTIPDNACTDIVNYEYRDYTGLKRRYDYGNSELNGAAIDEIKSFAIWYPSRKPTNMSSDKIYLVHSGSDLYVVYWSGLSWVKQAVFTDVPVDATVDYSTGFGRAVIADGTNPTRFIEINKQLELIYGNIGIEAPRYMPSVSLAGADNAYAETSETDTGMTIERGNILQYCYTVEDKYGVESNPSPIVSEQSLMWKYPDPTSVTGYKYYWRRAKLEGLRADQYPAEVRARLKYFNIYRRDIEFLEGTVSTQFRLIYRKPIAFGTNETYTDTSAEDYGTISYDKLPAPPAEYIVEANSIVYLGGVKTDGLKLPFGFDDIYSIKITNNNSIDYVNCVVSAVLSLGASVNTYIQNNPSKVRVFDSDLVTPLAVNYSIANQQLYVWLRLPVLDRNTVKTIYFCIANTASGVTDDSWNSYRYGKFFPITSGSWSQQKVFSPIHRVRSDKVLINTVAAYAGAPTSTYIENLANGLNTGQINEEADVSIVDGASTQPYLFHIDGHYIAAEENEDLSAIDYTINPLADSVTMVVTGKINKDIFGYDADYVTEKYIKRICRVGRLNICFYKPSFGFGLVEPAEAFAIGIFNNGFGNAGAVPANYRYVSILKGIYELPTGIVSSGRYDLNIAFSYKNTGQYRIVVRNNTTGDILHESSGTFVEDGMKNLIQDTNLKPALLSLKDANDLIFKFEVYDGVFAESTEQLINYINMYPVYPSQVIGGRLDSIPNNTSIAITKLTEFDLNPSNEKNRLYWSDITGHYFNALDFVSVNEPIKALLAAPSFLKYQYQNTVIIFTRNSVNRFVLTDDLSRMAQRPDSVIPEYTSGGLYAEASVIYAFNSIMWLSESGVMLWNPEGIANISKGIIDIPIDADAVGAYYAPNNQYWLYCPTTKITYVYHFLNNAWTTFTEIEYVQTRQLNLGEDMDNNLVMLDADGILHEYPTSIRAKQVQTIKTKQYRIDNHKPFRYRCRWDADVEPASVKATTYNSLAATPMIESVTDKPQRFSWILLPNGFWGEYIQFEITGSESLTGIDIDIKEGV